MGQLASCMMGRLAWAGADDFLAGAFLFGVLLADFFFVGLERVAFLAMRSPDESRACCKQSGDADWQCTMFL